MISHAGCSVQQCRARGSQLSCRVAPRPSVRRPAAALHESQAYPDTPARRGRQRAPQLLVGVQIVCCRCWPVPGDVPDAGLCVCATLSCSLLSCQKSFVVRNSFASACLSTSEFAPAANA